MSNHPTAGRARETVVLVPGLLCDATVWAHQQAALTSSYDVLVADITQDDAIGAMADSVLRLAPERFTLIGHSLGARVALELVRRAPARVSRLALLDTGIHPASADEPARRQVMLDLGREQGMAALARQWLPPMVHPRRLEDTAFMHGLTAMVERMSPAIHARQIRALLNRPDAAAALGDIGCPVLVGVGAQDAWSPPAQHAAIVARIPQAEYVVFPESGHMAPAEAPEAVTACLSAWIDAG